jgi:hypothetical protein
MTASRKPGGTARADGRMARRRPNKSRHMVARLEHDFGADFLARLVETCTASARDQAAATPATPPPDWVSETVADLERRFGPEFITELVNQFFRLAQQQLPPPPHVGSWEPAPLHFDMTLDLLRAPPIFDPKNGPPNNQNTPKIATSEPIRERGAHRTGRAEPGKPLEWRVADQTVGRPLRL